MSELEPLPEEIGNISKYYYAANAVLLSNNTVKGSNSNTPAKSKEITLKTIIHKQSTFRITFDLTPGLTTDVYGRIYKNGIAIGTEQTVAAAGPWTTFTEDFAGPWNQNDTIELWIHRTGAQTVSCRNFNICGTESTFQNTLL